MTNNYCGKSCETCAMREELSCPGCRDMAGRPYDLGQCEITKCCVTKNHADCSTCTSFANCHQRLSCANVPEYRRQRMAMKAEQDRWFAENAPEIGKLVWGIFVILMVAQVVGLLNLEFVQENFPALATFGQIATGVMSLLLALYLLRLGKFKDGFRIAGWCSLAAAAAHLVMTWISSRVLIIVVGIPVIAVGLVATWYEYSAFSELTAGLDDELSGSWSKLFKWEIGTLLGIFGCIILVLILSWLGIVALLVDAIALIVVQILYYVYIYRTAKRFKEYNK